MRRSTTLASLAPPCFLTNHGSVGFVIYYYFNNYSRHGRCKPRREPTPGRLDAVPAVNLLRGILAWLCLGFRMIP
jgi:hypothetical protein